MAVAAEDLTKGEATRLAVLDAAITRFGRDGYRSTSVADIARDVGVSGSAPFAYFATKEALFIAAVDHDAAAVMTEGFGGLAHGKSEHWRAQIIVGLLAALEHHPLAHRVLSGREPDFTARLLRVPALEHVRKLSRERIRQEQAAGIVRADVDPEAMANGLVAIVLSLLMTVVQTGIDVAMVLGQDGAEGGRHASPPVKSGSPGTGAGTPL